MINEIIVVLTIKFFIRDKKMENYIMLKDEMKKAAKRAFDIRLQSGDGGNLSVKIEGKDLILIKASGCSFGDMDYENIVLVDFNGDIVEGKYLPSKEILTHIEIYKTRNDVTAIFHCHSPWAVSAAQVFSKLPDVSMPLNMKIGKVPIINAEDDHANKDFAKLVNSLLKKNPNVRCFIQQRHGVFCLSNNIVKAEYDAELVEEASQVAVWSNILNYFKLDGKK